MRNGAQWGKSIFGLLLASLLIVPAVRAGNQGQVDVSVSGKIHAQFKDMEFVIDTGFMGKPIYRVTLTGAQPKTYAVSTIKLLFPEHLKPGTYKVIGAMNQNSPAISDKKVPTDSDPAKVLVGVSYGCDCEHHQMMQTYSWGPAHGQFVVTSDSGKRISGHFKFTQSTPNGKDKVTVSGKIDNLQL